MTDHAAQSLDNDIAIVGMAGRFPGAGSVRAFWQNLLGGVESVVPLSTHDLLKAGVAASLIEDPAYVKVAARYDDIDRFDAEFFGLNPREAAIMDPQHRHFLECAWEALEDAGHVPERFPGTIGVFGGCGMQAYFNYHLLPNAELMRSAGLFLVRHTGNDKDFLTTRASYILDLKGPSVAIQTACSTSLVAIHVACQSLLSYQCDLALAGGVTIELPQGVGYRYEEGGILSPDGKCRAFDAEARGTVFGSGVGIVALRRLADALADGDHVVAVVKGSAVNNDGAGKVGYFAPSVDGQSTAIYEALAVAGVDASTVGYVETHGTGTPLGDAIEMQALTDAFRRHTHRTGYCAIGSVKTNIGHLDTAAGVAGFIKAALAVERGVIPPSLNFTAPNPRFDLPSTPFFVNDAARAWSSQAGPRRAGVNSLGVGGTNAHVVLEEAPPQPPSAPSPRVQVLVLSARTAASLDRASVRLADFLAGESPIELADIAYTLQTGRRTFAHRRAVVCGSRDEAVARLRSAEAGRRASATRQGRVPPVAMLFPGGGAQFFGMGQELRDHEPVYRAAMDECRAALVRLGLADVDALPIWGHAGSGEDGTARLARPAASILSVFIVEYALVALWRSWGVEPSVLIGHSAGEYVAAQTAGVFSLDDALRIVACRGAIFERLDAGAMVSVGASEEAVSAWLPEGVDVAAVNGPGTCVLSGPLAGIVALEEELAKRDIPFGRLHIDVAAHSSMLDPHLDEFERALASVSFARPRLPLVSNVSGEAVGDEIATPAYWRQHLRQTVRFKAGIDHLLESFDQPVLLEVGPGHTLTSLVRARLGPESSRAWTIASMRHPKDTETDGEALARAVGDLWLAGVPLQWESVHGDGRRRVSLPTYAFERTRHWIDAPLPAWVSGQVSGASSTAIEGPSFEGRDWIYQPEWRVWDGVGLTPAGRVQCLLLALPNDARAMQLKAALEGRGAEVRLVHPGDAFVDRVTAYEVAPGRAEAFKALFDACRRAAFVPTHIVHAWRWGPPDEPRATALEESLRLGFEPLLALIQARDVRVDGPLSLSVLSTRAWSVGDEGVRSPEAALALGPVLTGTREYTGLRACALDTDEAADVASVAGVIVSGAAPSVLALRGSRTLERHLVQSCPPSLPQSPLRVGGTYLITGGLGGIAGVVAARLAREYRGTLVLIGRTPLPPREEWPSILRMAAVTPVARRVRRLQALESTGARVWYRSADIADPRAVGEVVREAVQAFGPLDGIFHAAGTLDDGAMATKAVERARRVILVKAAGAIALDEATEGTPPAVFVSFSSTSAWLGLEGQVDYTSANAYLDAFSEWRARTRPGRSLAIEWGAWRDVGMASRALGLEGQPDEPSGPDAAGHPLLGQLLIDEPGHLVFESRVRTTDRWELAEHRLSTGQAVLPGTAFVDMLWAAASRAIGSPTVELQQLVFESPCVVHDDASYLLRTTLRRRDDTWTALVESTVGGESGVVRTEHVRAVARAGELPRTKRPITETPGAASDPAFDPVTGLNPAQAQHVRFGERWRVLRHALRTEGMMVARLSLPERFRSDLIVPRIHPALFDIATTVALPLLEAGADAEVFVPFSYGRLTLGGALPEELFVWARPSAQSSRSGTASFDVTGVDPEGRVVFEVRDFVMRRIPTAAFNAVSVPPVDEPVELARLRQWVTRGIPSATGADLLVRLAGSTGPAAIMVTPVPFEELARVGGPADAGPTVQADAPSLAAATDAIADLWRELLGLERVKPDDDFFELGGHSLIAVRFVSRLERKLGTRLSLSALFQARTPRAIAELVSHEPESKWSSLVPVQVGGAQPSFYCAHPLGGEVLGYQRLAAAMGADQPFWGFRSRGHEGEHEPIGTIEGQAAQYVADMVERDPAGPYYLGGYSHGGRVAFEMARQLVDQGREVAFLAIIDTWPKQSEPRGLAEIAAWFANLPGWLRREVAGNEFWRNRQELERSVVRIRRHVTSRLRGLPQRPDISEEMNVSTLPDHIRRTIQANLTAFWTYEPGSFAGSAVLFRASAQPLASPATPDLGWSKYVTGELRVRHFAGTHRLLTKDPLVTELGRALREELDRARAVVEMRSTAAR